MVFPLDYSNVSLRGEPKGLRVVLSERGLWRAGLHLKCKNGCELGAANCCAVTIMASQSDFIEEKCWLEKMVVAMGHKVIFYPKFHCELNYIENFWSAVKQYMHANCNYTWKGLQETLPKGLNSVFLPTIQHFAKKVFHYMDIYCKDLTGKAAEHAARKYRSHRRVPDSVFNDININDV